MKDRNSAENAGLPVLQASKRPHFRTNRPTLLRRRRPSPRLLNRSRLWPPAPAPAPSNSLLKVGVAAVVIIFVGGIAALGAAYYVVHKVKEKVQAAVHQADGETPSSEASGLAALVQKATGSAASKDDDSSAFKGDPCRFLSKEEVSCAVGIEIIRADAQGVGCNYIAKGDPADMVSKHMTSMVTSQAKSNGSNPTAEQTKLMQQITGAFFKQQESSDKDLSKEAENRRGPHSFGQLQFRQRRIGNEDEPHGLQPNRGRQR